MARWTFDDIPCQAGRTAVVTGANSGLGFEAARQLTLKGANVIAACRHRGKGLEAVRRIRDESPEGNIASAALDLADLDSVARFADEFLADHRRLDLLINNGGVLTPPEGKTKQGFELQFGTNHLGHFALTGRLLPLILATPGARVTTVSSLGQYLGRIEFADLQFDQRGHQPWAAYGQSKLANLMFALELQRRLDAVGSTVRSTGSHPGWTASNLTRNASPMLRWLQPVVAEKAPVGAQTTLRAATDPEASGGSFWGPSRPLRAFGVTGPVRQARISVRARDTAVAEQLWDVSERLTGVSYVFVGSRA
jgi:NAD(P)-dependent dehydrogenase (short-subunit alcohol dehydrogenase family)